MTVKWKANSDGEFNQNDTVIDGQTFSIYSDRDGDRWYLECPDEVFQRLDSDSGGDAMVEAEQLIQDWIDEN